MRGNSKSESFPRSKKLQSKTWVLVHGHFHHPSEYRMSPNSAGLPQRFNPNLKRTHSSNVRSHKRNGGRFGQQPGRPSKQRSRKQLSEQLTSSKAASKRLAEVQGEDNDLKSTQKQTSAQESDRIASLGRKRRPELEYVSGKSH